MDSLGDSHNDDKQARETVGADNAGTVVLASRSVTRATILRQAGVSFVVDVAAVDETEIKRSLRGEGADASHAAATLAGLKALRVSGRHADSLVIGADQILECEGKWLDKPVDLAAARRDLVALRGRAHWQVTSVCVVRNQTSLWQHTDRARLFMRDFSDRFLDLYLESADDMVLDCVGAYRLEGVGAQLFSRVEGDYFSILGLPLLPLLGFLRGHGAVTE